MKTVFIKYKQFTAVRFNIGNLATDKLYVERVYHTTKFHRMSSVEFQTTQKSEMVQRKKAGRVYGGGIVDNVNKMQKTTW